MDYIKKIINEKKRLIFLVFILATIFSFMVSRKLEVKDALYMFVATYMIFATIFLIFYDKKISLLIFIMSLPILVIARKAFYVDFLIFKFTYEAVYITILTLVNLKNIKEYVNKLIKKDNKYEIYFIFWIAIFLVAALISSMFSKNIIESLRYAFSGVLIPILFYFSVVTIIGKSEKYKVIYCLIAGLNFSAIYGFIQIVMRKIPFNQISSNREFLTFGFHNVNVYANIIIISIPLLLEALFYKKMNSSKEKFFVYSSIILNTLAIFITFTRGAWLCYLISVFCILISKKYKKIFYLIIPALLISAKPVINIILTRGIPNVNFLANESSMARLLSIFTGFEIIKRFPFGIGGGSYGEFYKLYALKGYMLLPIDLRTKISVPTYALENAHNLWIQIAVEFGIIGVIVMLFILVNRLKGCLKNYSYNRGFFMCIINYIIYSIMTGIELNHKGIVTQTLILWMIFALIMFKEDNYNEKL